MSGTSLGIAFFFEHRDAERSDPKEIEQAASLLPGLKKPFVFKDFRRVAGLLIDILDRFQPLLAGLGGPDLTRIFFAAN